MNPSIDTLAMADAKALLVYLDPQYPELRRAVEGAPSGMKSLGNTVLQISKVQTLCAFERPVDLELFSESLNTSLEELPDLRIVFSYFIQSPGLETLNVELVNDDLVAAQIRFRDYLGSFFL